MATASKVSRAGGRAGPGSFELAYICFELLRRGRRRAPGNRRCSRSATAGWPPRMARGSAGPSATARTGETLPSAGGQRAVHPAARRWPSARACPIPCSPARRNASASGRASRRRPRSPGGRWSNSGFSGASDGCRPKKPSRSMAASRACRPAGRGHGDGGPQVVVGLLAVRHHDVQTIGRAALEDGHQNLLARRGRVRGIERALQPQRRRARPHHGQRRIAKKKRRVAHDDLLNRFICGERRRPEQPKHSGF